MFQNFILNQTEISIIGYDWELENPECVVCLIHGIGEHADRYDRIGEIFKASGIALTSMDLRGHGNSAGKRGHTAPRKDILTDVDQMIEHAAKKYPGVPILLYGHSMGGNMALEYRKRGNLRQKLSGYIVTAPWILLVRKIPNYLYAFVKFMSIIKPDFPINTNIKNETLGNLDIINKQENKHLMHGKISVKTAIDGLEIGKELINETLTQDGNGDPKPLLLMHGDADKVCLPEGSRIIAELEKELCTYIEWKGLYHEIHNGSPTDDGIMVIDTIVKWIKQFDSK